MCVGDIIPEPRPVKAQASSASVQEMVTDDTFQYLRLNQKDVVQEITARVRKVHLQSARHANLLCIHSSQFLSKTYISTQSPVNFTYSPQRTNRRGDLWDGGTGKLLYFHSGRL